MSDFPVLTRQSAQLDLSSTGDKASIRFVRQARLVSVGLLFENNDASASTTEIDKRVLAGSDTGRVNLATIEKPASDKQGKYIKKELDESSPEVLVDCGDELVIECTVAAGASQLVSAHIEYLDIPENRANLADAEETA